MKICERWNFVFKRLYTLLTQIRVCLLSRGSASNEFLCALSNIIAWLNLQGKKSSKYHWRPIFKLIPFALPILCKDKKILSYETFASSMVRFVFHLYSKMTFLTKRKQTKRVLRKIYYSPQSKASICFEVAVETKLFPDSALGNSLCTSGYKTKSESFSH